MRRRRRASASSSAFRQAVRRRARHRPDRLGQVDDALRGAQRCSTRSRRTSSRSRTRSSTSSTGSTRCRSTRKAGLTFATGLRSMLRADPDIIMVGEIRDRETAQIAIEAALTGHLVLSTLHTNDAPTRDHPPDRDGDRAVPRRLSALDCVVAQRLARTLCKHCKRRTILTAGGRSPTTASTSSVDIEAYEPGRLRALRRLRLQGPDRPLRGDDGHRGDPHADDRARLGRPRSPRSPCAKGMRRLREDGLEKVRAGPHLDRRGRARHRQRARRRDR